MRVASHADRRDTDARSVARGDRIAYRVAAALGALAGSLWLASGLHLAGLVDGRGAPFNAEHAGVAEALIGIVVAAAAEALRRTGSRAWRGGLWAIGFAIAGFCWGLAITSRGGHWPDISYHLVGLSVLITCVVALLRAGRRPAL